MITMIWDNFPSGILRHWNVQMSYHVLPHYIKYHIFKLMQKNYNFDMMTPAPTGGASGATQMF